MEAAASENSQGKELLKGYNVSFQIFYAGHSVTDSLEALKDPFEKCDIYVPESVSWTTESRKEYEDVSSGLIPVDVIQSLRVKDSFRYQELMMVNNSHKSIAIIDLPKGHPLIDNFHVLVKEWYENGYIRNTFGETLDAIISLIRKNGGIQKEREEYMLSGLEPEISRTISNSPLLKDKKEIRVLMLLGSTHQQFFKNMEKSEYQVSKVFSSTLTDSFRDEALKTILSGGEINRDFAAKCFLEHESEILFGSYIKGITDNSRKRLLFFRSIASQFTFEESERVFKAFKDGGSVRSIFDKKFKEKGIKLPQSPAQLEDFLAKPLSLDSQKPID